MGTKNNPKNRVKTVEKAKYNGREVEPVFYYGKHAGHGNFMAAIFTDKAELVVDEKGSPLPWQKVAKSNNS